MIKHFSALVVHEILAATPISKLLLNSDAVVLERIARGAGATNWYLCRGIANLAELAKCLSPGSAVSFYFDGRIRSEYYSPELTLRVKKLLFDEGEVVFGVLGKHDSSIKMDVITGHCELDDLTSLLDSDSQIFYGLFPNRDNDGEGAVTVVLPDIDGVVRAHPH